MDESSLRRADCKIDQNSSHTSNEKNTARRFLANLSLQHLALPRQEFDKDNKHRYERHTPLQPDAEPDAAGNVLLPLAAAREGQRKRIILDTIFRPVEYVEQYEITKTATRRNARTTDNPSRKQRILTLASSSASRLLWLEMSCWNKEMLLRQKQPNCKMEIASSTETHIPHGLS